MINIFEPVQETYSPVIWVIDQVFPFDVFLWLINILFNTDIITDHFVYVFVLFVATCVVQFDAV